MTRPSPARPHLIGSTIALPRLDLEAACLELRRLGFGGVEVFIGQIGPGIVDVPLRRTHAAAVGEMMRDLELTPIMLNAIDGHFDPVGDPAGSAERLAEHLRLAAAMEMPRVLTWDGILPQGASASIAPRALADCIVSALDQSRLPAPPAVAVELHPFTFALAHGLLDETANALIDAEAGICLDYCHFGVALGPSFASDLSSVVLDAVSHVHWCDSDCETSELHFPPGAGVLDLDELGRLFDGDDLELAWDIFGWPAPRAALSQTMPIYAKAVVAHLSTVEQPP